MYQNNIKYRITGALVLIGLAVIVLPFFLDGSGYQEIRQIQTMPIEPEPEPATAIAIEIVDISDPDIINFGVVDLLPEVTPRPNDPPQANTNLLNDNKLPKAWSVQIGLFKNRQNANRLHDKYQSAGYNVYVVSTDREHRVMAGPVFNRDQALHLKAELLDKFKQNDLFLVLYEVEE